MRYAKALQFLGMFFLAVSAFSQTNVNEEQGLKPYDSWHGGDLDSVSMTNGGLILHVPLAAFPQRGNLDLSYSVRYSTKQWLWRCNHHNPPQCGWATAPNSGTQIVSSVDWWMQATNVADLDLGGRDWSRGVTSPDGNTHQLGTQQGGLSGPVFPLRSLDATGLLHLDNNTLVLANGTRYSYPTLAVSTNTGGINGLVEGVQASTVADSNGNQININSTGANVGWVDTMGRWIPGSVPTHTNAGQGGTLPVQPGVPTTDLSNCTSGTATALIWNIPGIGATTRTYKFCFSNISVAVSFPNGGSYGPVTWSLLTAVVQPDLTKWTFTYDGNGSLTRLGFPTGGSISYTYVWGPNICDGVGGTPQSLMVATRAVDANDGAGARTWNYSYALQSPSLVTTVTDPAGNQAVHTSTAPVAGECSLYENQAQYYQGTSATGTLLKTVSTQYSANDLYQDSGDIALNTVPTQVTSTLGTKTSKIVNTYDTSTTNADGNPVIIGSVLEKDDYDFSNMLVRSTLNHYVWQDNSTYKSNNFVGLLSSKTVCSQSINCVDGTLANRMAQTTYGYDETAVTSSGITTQHTSPPAGGNVRGNSTTVSHWLNSPSSLISSSAAYFDTGMKASSTDPLSYTSTYTYSSTFIGAYLTQTNLPDTGSPVVHHVISGNYDFNTGLLTRFIDENSQQFTYTYDNMLRLAEGDHPDGGKTTFSYPDPNTVTRQHLITSTPTLMYDTYTTKFDGLGRPYQTLHATPAGTAYVDTVYDQNGRVWKVSNPYYQTTDQTYGVTETQYDGLSRKLKIIKPDTGFSTASYIDNCTIATDEAGKQRKVCNDALGRMANVYEDPAGLNYETDYQYDVLNNLIRIDQKGSAPTDSTKWRTRTFTYDSLSRLSTATNPESGEIFYFYDNVGNLLQKVMPSPNQTGSAQHTISYCYDQLNRVNGRAYSWQNCQNGQLPLGTAVVTYTYDQGINGIGHLTGLTDQAGSATYNYDIMGRLATEQRTIAGVTKSMSYNYNLDGSSKTLTYPSGAVVTYTSDSASRMVSAIDIGNNINYVTSATYGPSDSLTGFINGQNGSFGGIYNTFVYNNRLQPCRIAVSNTSPVASDCLVGWGNVLDLGYDFHLGNGDNGNLFTINKWGDQTRSKAFTYDALNRLASAQTAGTDCAVILPDGHTKFWGNSYSYDSWGNLLSKTPTECTAENLSVTADTKNQVHAITGTDYTYDAAGNMMQMPATAMTMSTTPRIASAVWPGIPTPTMRLETG